MILKPRPFRKPRKGHLLMPDVGLWLFNEGSGDQVLDLSGNRNTGILGIEDLYIPVWTTDRSGTALAFTSDFIRLPSVGSLKRASQSGLTVIYKINMGSINSYDCVVSAGRYDTSWAMMHNAGTTVPRAYAFNRAINCPVDFGTGEYTLAFTANTARFDWYKNGAWVGESIGAGTWEMDSNSAGIGSSYSGVAWGYNLSDAILSWVMVFSRVLSASEIALLYREPFCMFERDPIELWSAATLGAAPPVGMAGAMTTNTGYWGW